LFELLPRNENSVGDVSAVFDSASRMSEKPFRDFLSELRRADDDRLLNANRVVDYEIGEALDRPTKRPGLVVRNGLDEHVSRVLGFFVGFIFDSVFAAILAEYAVNAASFFGTIYALYFETMCAKKSIEFSLAPLYND